MAGGGWQHLKGAGELGTVGAGAETGGGGPESVTEFLYCRDTAGPLLWGGVVDFDRENGICPGRLPGQGSQADDRTAALSGEQWDMVLPLPGGGPKGGGCREGQDIDPPEIEYGHAIYCNEADSGDL